MNNLLLKPPTTVEDFKIFVDDVRGQSTHKDPLLFSVGQKVKTKNGTLASVRYPVVNGFGQNIGSAAVLMHVLKISPEGVQNKILTADNVRLILQYFSAFENDGKRHTNIELFKFILKQLEYKSGHDESTEIIASFIFDDVNPIGVEDSTLKLYALSNRIFKPNQLNLSAVFTKFPNVAWVDDRPFDADEVDECLLNAAFSNESFAPHMVDKFPLYIHRINAIKMGVRITDQHKVRLGAYLGEGTTLMPGASYINFNAGTDGASMIEGRVSSSAFVGKGSDVGGGASILGTLSGGNNTPISIGRNCLLEANSVLGIPIGDAVIVSSNTAILSSSVVQVNVNGHSLYGKNVKASHLIGINAVTFRTNNVTGALEMVRSQRNIDFAKKLENGQSILNADLHNNSNSAL
jgi:2,3,4,5-tetrahydropyridine-2,6-dicarboxylate N-succinyltransferase